MAILKGDRPRLGDVTNTETVLKPMTLSTIQVDYQNPQQAQDLIGLLEHYATGASGGRKSLGEYVKSNLIDELMKIPSAFSVICYDEEKPAGLINAFWGFSTFKCRPLVNIHDLIVHSDFRRRGISQLLLQKVEEIALEKNAAKLTLEVLDKNYSAINAYHKFGFAGYELDPSFGKAIFLEKSLG